MRSKLSESKIINTSKIDLNNRSWLMLTLSFKDLFHEWILSLCMILSITSFLAPLLLLFGIKYGLIESMRDNLISDPRNREVRPISPDHFSKENIERLKSLDNVAYILPTVRKLASNVDVGSKGETETNVDIIPTSMGDPLLLGYGSKIPNESECVVTERLAKDLNLHQGDILDISVKRIINGIYQKEKITLKVVDILNPIANTLPALYASSIFVDAVEQYKDGLAVSHYNWKGENAIARPVFNGLAIITETTLTPKEQVSISSGTGFSTLTLLTPKQWQTYFGFPLNDDNRYYYLASVKSHYLTEENINALKNKLRGRTANYLPWIAPIRITSMESKDPKLLYALPDKMDQWDYFSPFSQAINSIQNNISKDSSNSNDDNSLMNLIITNNMSGAGMIQILESNLELPVTYYDYLKEQEQEEKQLQSVKYATPESLEQLFAPSSFVGLLALSKKRALKFDEKTEKLLLMKRDFASFRLYTNTIDQVEPLREKLKSQGIEVNTKAERILEVKRLDKNLTIIFWLISIVALIGGIASLLANIYASVERKRKELSILRLLGVSGGQLFLFPIFGSLILSTIAVLSSFILYFCAASLINWLFENYLTGISRLAHLSLGHFIVTFCLVLGIAIAVGAMAAWKTTQIEPSEALRDE